MKKKNIFSTIFCCVICSFFLSACASNTQTTEVVFSTVETKPMYVNEEKFFDISNLKNFEQNYQGKTVKVLEKDGTTRVGTFEKTKVTFSEEELSRLPVPYTVEPIPKYAHSFFPLNTIKYIVVHNTADNGTAADHYYHISHHDNAQTSAHFYVDDNEIIQALPTNMECWSVGTNKNLKVQDITNANSINIEICETGDIGKAIENGMYLIKYLLHPAFPDALIVRHYDATLKDCPRYIQGENWDNFLLNSYNGEIPVDYYDKLALTKQE